MQKNKRNAFIHRLRRELRQYTYDLPTFYTVAHDLARYMGIGGDYAAHKKLARSVLLYHLGYSFDMPRWQSWRDAELARREYMAVEQADYRKAVQSGELKPDYNRE